jgi:RNA polymerase sigma-70 factor (ECF subfamily)
VEHTEQQVAASEQLEQLRPYLRAIARLQIEKQFQAKIDASDVVQQTMLEACRGIDEFRGATPEELRGWLRRILSRNLADEVRRFRRGKRDAGAERSIEAGLTQSSLFLERFLAGPNTRPDEAAVRNENLGQLSAAIESLPEDQRRAVVLHHLEGRTAAEIGRELGKTEIAVAGLLRRGMKRLREVMRPADDN